jgi:hypothetical protein
MKSCKKYTALFLLLVFAWALLPGPLLHEFFADHHDTACELQHDSSTAQVEATHTHCDIFTTNSPVYDAPRLVVFTQPIAEAGGEVVCALTQHYLRPLIGNTLSRGPPAA